MFKEKYTRLSLQRLIRKWSFIKIFFMDFKVLLRKQRVHTTNGKGIVENFTLMRYFLLMHLGILKLYLSKLFRNELFSLLYYCVLSLPSYFLFSPCLQLNKMFTKNS